MDMSIVADFNRLKESANQLADEIKAVPFALGAIPPLCKEVLAGLDSLERKILASIPAPATPVSAVVEEVVDGAGVAIPLVIDEQESGPEGEDPDPVVAPFVPIHESTDSVLNSLQTDGKSTISNEVSGEVESSGQKSEEQTEAGDTPNVVQEKPDDGSGNIPQDGEKSE